MKPYLVGIFGLSLLVTAAMLYISAFVFNTEPYAGLYNRKGLIALAGLVFMALGLVMRLRA